MVQSRTPSPSGSEHVLNGVRLAADVAVTPGVSHLLDGRVGQGVVYAGGALVARYLLGPLGWLAVALDSYSVSASGKHLWEQNFLPTSSDHS
jgi:hypothetical protein